MKTLLPCVALLLIAPLVSSAGVNVDLTVPVTLAPGTYRASTFNCLFENGGGGNFIVTGSFTPLVSRPGGRCASCRRPSG
jgi:hypothetical protein